MTDQRQQKLQAFQLGLQFRAKEAGMDQPRIEFFKRICREHALHPEKTASEVLQKVALDEDQASLLLHAAGGGAIGASGSYLLHKIRQALAGESPENREQKKRRNDALLYGGLTGAGLGLTKHYLDRGQIPEITIPTE